jgi:hypothetical protein
VHEVSTWIYVPVAAVALKTARLSTNPFLRIKRKQLDKDFANERSQSVEDNTRKRSSDRLLGTQ